MSFNLFKKKLVDIRHGIYSTRVYAILLGMGIVVLTVYSSVIQSTTSVTIQNPTLLQFEQLYQKYSSALSCRCQSLSVIHSSIMTIQPRYHQVCMSTFVQNDGWLRYWPLTLINANGSSIAGFFGSDFRLTGQTFFEQLKTFCDAAIEIVTNAVEVFNETNFVSARPLAQDDFNAQTSALFTQFKQQVSH